MRTPQSNELLQVWERGAGQPASIRALLLMEAVSREHDSDALARWSIGQRDRLLLDLRVALFGPEVHCVTDCAHCGEPIELDFRTADICVPYGEPDRSYHAAADGYQVQFRLPDTNDLLSIEGALPEQAEQRLLERCILGASTKEGEVGAATLPEPVLTAVSQGMGEVDPQAEVLLDVSCPACSAISPALFDIVSHLWIELDAWARRTLQQVHTLAMAYGWSEAEILRLSTVRQRAYLDLIGG